MLRQMYEAANNPDAAASDDYLHPEAELHLNPDMPGADSYIGREEFMRGFRDWLEGWREFRFELQDVAEEDGFVVVRMQLRGWGKASGIEADQQVHHVWTIRDGKAHRCVIRPTREAALDEARRLL
jgi:ketosteroid isomerase-like protein